MSDTIAEAAKQFLENIPLLAEAGKDDRRHVENLLHQRGLAVLLGLLLAERQGYYTMLAVAQAGTPEGLQHLGVLQGRIIGIERIRETLLECVTVPTEPKE